MVTIDTLDALHARHILQTLSESMYPSQCVVTLHTLPALRTLYTLQTLDKLRMRSYSGGTGALRQQRCMHTPSESIYPSPCIRVMYPSQCIRVKCVGTGALRQSAGPLLPHAEERPTTRAPPTPPHRGTCPLRHSHAGGPPPLRNAPLHRVVVVPGQVRPERPPQPRSPADSLASGFRVHGFIGQSIWISQCRSKP